MIYYLYRIFNKINEKRYIGWCTNTRRRWNEHKSGHGSVIVFNAIKKYGVENFTFRILKQSKSKKIIFGSEKTYIKRYKTLVPFGYNISAGGAGPVGVKATAGKRKRMSRAQKRRFSDTKEVEKLRQRQLDIWQRPGYRTRMSRLHKGQEVSEHARQLISKQGKITWQDPVYRAKMSLLRLGKIRNHKPIYVNDYKYSSYTEASLAFNLPSYTITQWLVRWRKTGKPPKGIKICHKSSFVRIYI